MHFVELLTVLLLGAVSSQEVPTENAYPVEWTQQLGTSTGDFGGSLAVDDDGNVYMTGHTGGDLGGPNLGSSDAFVSKYDKHGQLQWVKQFGTDRFEPVSDIALDGMGNIYLSGTTGGNFGGTLSGGYDSFLMKINSLGEEEWVEQLGSNRLDSGRSVAVDEEGNVWFSGEYHSASESPPSEAFLAKYDTNGVQQWFTATSTTEFDLSEAVAIDSLGNSYITGYIDRSRSNPARSTEIFLAKYDVLGNLVWRQEFGTTSGDNPRDIAVDSAGNVYVAGSTSGLLGDRLYGSLEIIDSFVAKFNSDGEQQWVTQFGGDRADSISRVAIGPDDSLFVSGDAYDKLGEEFFGSVDVFISQIDSDGELLWLQQFGTSDLELNRGVAVDAQGNPYLSGYTRGDLGGTNVGFQDAFLIKLKAPNAIPEPSSLLLLFVALAGVSCIARSGRS